jgi:hypothetical protein
MSEDIERKILDALRKGGLRSRTSHWIRHEVGLPASYTETLLRGIIKKMIKKGHPIGSNRKGYFLITSSEDLEKVKDELKGRSKKNMERGELIEQAVYESEVLKAIPFEKSGAKTEKKILSEVDKKMNRRKNGFINTIISLIEKGNMVITIPGKTDKFFLTESLDEFDVEQRRLFFAMNSIPFNSCEKRRTACVRWSACIEALLLRKAR